jgi:hypothetical protein
MANVLIEYENYASSSSYSYNRTAYTNQNGVYTLQGLMEGIAAIRVEPSVSSGYVFELRYIYLSQSENMTGVDFQLKQGYLVSGYVKDSSGAGVPNVYVRANSSAQSMFTFMKTDTHGYYEMILPARMYNINPDNNFGVGLPEVITVAGPMSAPDIIMYNSSTGSSVSGSIDNTGGYGVNSEFMVGALEAGVLLNIRVVSPVFRIYFT